MGEEGVVGQLVQVHSVDLGQDGEEEDDSVLHTGEVVPGQQVEVGTEHPTLSVSQGCLDVGQPGLVSTQQSLQNSQVVSAWRR